MAVRMVPFVEELYGSQYKAKRESRYQTSGYSLVEPVDRDSRAIFFEAELYRRAGYPGIPRGRWPSAQRPSRLASRDEQAEVNNRRPQRVGSAQSLHPFAPARIDPGVPAIDLFADAPV